MTAETGRYVLRLVRSTGPVPEARPHWLFRSREAYWRITSQRDQAKTWESRAAAEDAAARLTSGAYEFVPEKFLPGTG